VGTSTSIWYSGAALNLSGLIEWELFRCSLINSGVQLHDLPDALIWTGGDQTGITLVKKNYLAMEKNKWTHTISGWKKALWSWACLLKAKIFIWLVVANIILTWEVLQHRGFIGLGYCILCKTNCETTNHLLVDCDFTAAIWNIIQLLLYPQFTWSGTSLEECFNSWHKQIKTLTNLSTFICWFVWKERNSTIFDDQQPSLQRVVYRATTTL